MCRALGLALLALVGTVGPSQASGFTEKGLSLLGYQLCSQRVTRSVQSVEVVQTSRVTYEPCGGWVPWRRCPKTVYRTQYVVVEVPETRNVTDCCTGYEQLGLYCVLPLNRSGEFASRPGACPTAGPETPSSPCSLDTDCPGLQKCCPRPGGRRCLVPTPPAPGRNSGSFWYNVTVLVKMDFKDLEQVDPGLLNHMRLLYSLVTSALQPLGSTVHHLHSAGGDTSTTVSRLLLGLPRLLPVAKVSAMLDDVVRRVYEVIRVQVQDVNECFYDALNACSAGELCANLEGSYRCLPAQESPTSVASQEPDHTSDGNDWALRMTRGRPKGPLQGEMGSLGAGGTVGLGADGGLPKQQGVGIGANRSGALAAGPTPDSGSCRVLVNHQETGQPFFPLHGGCLAWGQDFHGFGASSQTLRLDGGRSDLWSQLKGDIEKPKGVLADEGLKTQSRGPTLEGRGAGVEEHFRVFQYPKVCPMEEGREAQNRCHGAQIRVWAGPGVLCGLQEDPSPPSPPAHLLRLQDCPPIRDYMALDVTSGGFRVSWGVNATRSRTFHVQVFRGEELLWSAETEGPGLAVAGLEAGALYGVKTSYQGCGANVSAALAVKTDARVFEVTIRIVNRNWTEQLLNRSSVEHQDFATQLLHEVENSFPPAVADLHRRGKLRMQVESLRAGSVVARLRLTVWDPEFPVGVSTLSPMLQPLLASTVFQIDPRGTRVQDWDECADSSEHDCSPNARCVNLEGSYTCQCRSARDANPSRAGRVCEGDLVSPSDNVLTSAAAPSTGPTFPGPETSPPSPSPALLRATSAAGQAQTPGPPPGRGGSGTVGHYRNSTGQGVEEEFLGNSSTGPPSWPIPAEGPTGHVAWHASLPTRETPLNSTWLQREDPGRSQPPDLPSAPTPLTPAACGPVSLGRVTVSNVTSTGFRLAWAEGPSPSPTFRIMLTSPRGASVGLETRHASVLLSGLEPGVLHEVEVVATACGVEGARARLKVRTAAQKLSGQVRIANVRFSDSFRNTSSREYRDFLELFFRMVRDSLPDTLLRHLDAGGVRVEVASVTNGSVVVEFHLLIVADLDVREVSATFLAALQNASLLEVVRGDTFLWDYDECERNEDDCVPGTSCQNTLGSFTCRCEGRAPDFHVEYSGRPCEGVSPGNATWAPSPEQTPTPTGTGAALLQGASPTPRGLSQRLNLTGAVRVLCEIEKVAIAIQKRFLQQESIPESSLYLGHPSCNVSDSNSTHVLLVAGWGECGTVVQSNMTSTVVRTTLRNDQSPEVVMHSLKILSPIRCAFQNDLLASSGYTPQWGVYTIIEDLHGAGSFVTEMQLFIGDSPIPQNYSVSASDDVKIEVGLYRQKSGLKVVLTECWATPSSNARDPVTFGFINNSCPVPNTYTSVIENGNSNRAQFKLKIFSFINNSIVYLHCKLRICMESPGATCKIDCSDFRLLKSSDSSATHQTSWGPLFRSEGESPGAEPGLGAGYVVLIAVAVLILVAVAAALLIVRYQRMNGKYSFRIRSNNFSYRVFSE
ncbi:uromodulin-like 1 [Microcebus murinus]|uniref:uromodulin-like 1 n=1 Tax=Microcebus murinus TaxID=30608 RepID=UPI003F6C6FEB